MIKIEQLKEASEQGAQDISLLLTQLRENADEHTASLNELQAITGDKNTALIVAKDDGHIVGMATLYILVKFGKRVGTIEDVVVDSKYRGQGIGEKLMRAAIDAARAASVKTLHLTSRPERTAGNMLYKKLGFEIKQTNPYRLKL